MCRQSNVAGYEYKYLLLIKFSSSPDVGCRPYKMLRCQKPLSPSWLNSSVSLKKTVESIISQLNVSHLSSLVDRLVQKKAITSLGSKRQTRAKRGKVGDIRCVVRRCNSNSPPLTALFTAEAAAFWHDRCQSAQRCAAADITVLKVTVKTATVCTWGSRMSWEIS